MHAKFKKEPLFTAPDGVRKVVLIKFIVFDLFFHRLRIIYAEGVDGYGFYDLGRRRLVVHACLAGGYGINHLLTFNDAPKSGIGSVKMG